ncbi:MAG: hypothetical protein RSC28_04410, partial [Bacteroidales bacterium]
YFAAENKERAYWDSIGTAESKGMAKGMAKGIEKGIKKGREEGREEGMAKGREEGIEKGIEATATAMKGKNIDVELIAQCTGLTVEQVEAL